MEVLNLHGVKHQDVPKIVEDFLYMKDLPVKIITGNSPVMQSVVQQILKQYNLRSEPESYWNLGALIVTEG